MVVNARVFPLSFPVRNHYGVNSASLLYIDCPEKPFPAVIRYHRNFTIVISYHHLNIQRQEFLYDRGK